VLALIDLTSLNDSDTEQDMSLLCQKAMTRHGPVAAVCVYPQFVKQVSHALSATPIKTATVVNFPLGLNSLDDILASISQAIVDGADEIDLVFPLKDYLNGSTAKALEVVRESKRRCGASITLKVILETGAIADPELISTIAEEVILAGADFLKTSTGKIQMGATLEAARLMLNAISQSGREVGFKASGGIRTLVQAEAYLQIAQQMMGPGWVSAKTLRFGVSQLLDRVCHVLDLG
jgi:deoxyribose-phosphate aldolase